MVCDDFRSEHTPGVAAAAWQAVLSEGFHPLVISPMEMYGTWSSPDEWHEGLRHHLPQSGLEWEEQFIAEYSLYRVWERPWTKSKYVVHQLTPPVVPQMRRWVRRLQ